MVMYKTSQSPPCKRTQKEIILERIRKTGSITNTWAVNNYILRLSERIRELEADGMEFTKAYGSQLKKHKQYHKTYFYYPVR